jgi:hypothetical protein
MSATAEVLRIPEFKLLRSPTPFRPKQSMMSDADRKAAHAFGCSPDLLGNILDAYRALSLSVDGSEAQLILYYVASCSRMLDNPLSIMSISSSGAGKSAFQNATLQLSPPESVVRVSSMSPKCLFYLDQDAIRNRVLSFEELAGGKNETLLYALRTLMSEGALRYQVTARTGGESSVVERQVDGPASIFMSTTEFNPNSETLSRMYQIGIDESPKATAEIIAKQREALTLAGIAKRETAQRVVNLNCNFQRLLKSYRIVLPDTIAQRLDYADERLEARRGHKRFLSLIQAVAHLRQLTKPIQHFSETGLDFEYIEVDETDVDVAVRIFATLYGHTLDDLKAPSKELLFLLNDMVNQTASTAAERKRCTFTRREVLEFAPHWSKTRLHLYLTELTEHELVAKVSGKKNCLEHYRLLWDGQGKDGNRFVIGLRS